MHARKQAAPRGGGGGCQPGCQHSARHTSRAGVTLPGPVRGRGLRAFVSIPTPAARVGRGEGDQPLGGLELAWPGWCMYVWRGGGQPSSAGEPWPGLAGVYMRDHGKASDSTDSHTKSVFDRAIGTTLMLTG